MNKLRTIAIGLEILFILGIIIFWLDYFSALLNLAGIPGTISGKTRSFLETYEAATIFPDAVVLVILIASVLLKFRKKSIGALLGVMAGSMLIYLGLMDLSFFGLNAYFLNMKSHLILHVVIVAGGGGIVFLNYKDAGR